MNRWGIAAVLVVAGIALAGCGGGKSASDHSGCLLVQTRYSEMVNVMDRWQYGNATDTAMLDALQDLQSGAEYQQDAAKTEEFKAASATLSTATGSVYKAVNSGVGFESAAHDLADASRALNSVCAKWS